MRWLRRLLRRERRGFPLAVKFTHPEWLAMSDGIDKLLNLEARQEAKEITSYQFGLLEALLTRMPE